MIDTDPEIGKALSQDRLSWPPCDIEFPIEAKPTVDAISASASASAATSPSGDFTLLARKVEQIQRDSPLLLYGDEVYEDVLEIRYSW